MSVKILLVIDDDEVDRKAVDRALAALDMDYELHEASLGRQGVEMARTNAFDCILVDYRLPDMSGLDLLVQLREQTDISAPMVMLTGMGNEAIAVEAMKRGAHDYMTKENLSPVTLSRVIAHAAEMHAQQKQLSESQKRLERLALYDPLTGLGNRNLFDYELARTIAIVRRKSSSFLLLVMDLNKFKTVNDTHGHEAGDAILAMVGARLRSLARASDTYFRTGGDEFSAIIDADSDTMAIAGRIMAAIGKPVRFGNHDLSVGISIGFAAYHGDAMRAEDLIRSADADMYNSKKYANGATGVAVVK
jgi:diguanylate cyclase (GGDEF)-like protein